MTITDRSPRPHPVRARSARRRALLAACLCLAWLPAQAQLFALPPAGEDLVGQVRYIKARQSDTLLDIARRFDLGYEQIRAANPKVDTWLPGEGTRVRLPTFYILPNAPREGIVINVAEMRLYYYPKPGANETPRVETYPISIGRQNWNTPLTVTRVISKITDPEWFPPASIRAEHAANGEPLPLRVAPGEDNPLGRFALQLALPSYFIHGTNRDYGIGMQVTHGCIRLYPEDISQLFKAVPLKTPVRIVNQPYKSGWKNGALYIEVHPPLDGTPIEVSQNLTPVVQAVINATAKRANYPVNWHRVQYAGRIHSGIPLQVGPSSLPIEAAEARR